MSCMIESKTQAAHSDNGVDLEVLSPDLFEDTGSVQNVPFRRGSYSDLIIWTTALFKKWGLEGNGYVLCDLGDIACPTDCKPL